jgi:hypothetical protein
MNKIIIGLIGLMLCLMILPMVNAEDQERYKPLDLVITSNIATSCALLVTTQPDGTKETQNLAMAKDNQAFSIHIEGGNYTQLGEVCHKIFCTDGTDSVTNDECFKVTTTGNSNNLYLPLILGIFGLTLMVVAMWKKNGWLGLFSGFVFIILGIYSMIYGLGVIQDQYTEMISYVILGWGLILCFVAIAEELYGDGGESSD